MLTSTVLSPHKAIIFINIHFWCFCFLNTLMCGKYLLRLRINGNYFSLLWNFNWPWQPLFFKVKQKTKRHFEVLCWDILDGEQNTLLAHGWMTEPQQIDFYFWHQHMCCHWPGDNLSASPVIQVRSSFFWTLGFSITLSFCASFKLQIALRLPIVICYGKWVYSYTQNSSWNNL